jgi:putative transposase
MQRWLDRIVRELRTVLPGEAVARTARATSLVERNREIGSVPFVWSFLFGTTQPDGSVTKVQDFYKTFTEHDAAYSSIQQWITPELKTLLTEIVAHLSIELGGTEPSLGGRFDRFRDVFIADATDCTLSPESFEDFPGYGDDHAGARLHVIESLASRAPFFTSITDVRTGELSQLEIGDWIADSLLLDDLGYHDYGKLAQIDEHGGWFVNRLKIDSNVLITDELRRWRGNAISLEGAQLQDVLPDLYRSEIDVTASFDTPSADSELLPREFRLVGLRHDEATDGDDAPDADHDYHLYVTNLPRQWFTPRELAALYSNRWSVETLVQEAKSVFELDEISVYRTEAIECFMLASVVMVLLSRYLLRQIRAGLGSACHGSVEEETETQPMSFSKRLQWYGTDILETLAQQFGYSWDPGIAIIEGAIDRNVNRHALTERVAHGTVDPDLTNTGELATIRPG